MMQHEYKRLERQVQEIESFIPQMSAQNIAVSGASVGWHISHSLKVIHNVLVAIRDSKPEAYKRSFNFKRFMVFLSRRIPRGKVKSPKVVLPDDHLSTESLGLQLTKVKELLPLLNSLPKNAFFDHPFLNQLNREQTKKFLSIHTEHHLKIIRDILSR